MKKILALLLMTVIMLFPLISYAQQGNSDEQAIAQLVNQVSMSDK